MKNVRIIGVPEHFNYPWQLCLAEGAFEEHGIAIQWQDIPEGTGRMRDMLQSGEADLAIMLTEGTLKAISDGLQAVLVQKYIATPLLWGIHVAADSDFKSVADLKGTRAAISRMGSGSHLMAYVHAKAMGWDSDELRFEIIHTLDGAKEALTEARADYFMWEQFTTQPVVDAGIFRRIGVCPTPWPCFVIVARKEFANQEKALIQSLLATINQTTREFKNIPSIDRTLANYYEQDLHQIQQWLKLTQWSQEPLSLSSAKMCMETLTSLGLLGTAADPLNNLW